MRFLKFAMLAAAMLPLSSHATLGGAPSVSAPSSAALRATSPSDTAASSAPSANAAPYSVRQSADANGVTVSEYVLPENVVFAVKWNGPIRPDMTALLGSYFPNFVDSAKSGTAGTGPLIGGNDDFRVESAGRQGWFSGMAWLPRLMPAGVQAADLE